MLLLHVLPLLARGLVVAAILSVVIRELWRRRLRTDNADSTARDDKPQAEDALLLLQSCPMTAAVEPLADLCWADTEAPKLRPFKPVYHITMALQASPPADLIIMDKHYRARVLERRRLMAQHPATVVGATRPGAAAVAELYAFLMAAYLPARFPTMFALAAGGGTVLRNRVTGTAFPTTTTDDPVRALRRLGETVDDDMFLLQREAAGHRCVAFVCCFPSGFDPARKLGKLLGEIHAPVPGYERIGPSMERFFGRVEVGRNVKRVNWSIVDSPVLFNCGSNHVNKEDVASVVRDADIDISQARVRCELQTVSRLPRTGAILFSFKTHLYTLAEIKAEGRGDELAEAIEGLRKGNAPGMWTYKGAVRWARAVNEYLRS